MCVGRDHEPTDFPVFGPKMIAGIGRLPDTVDDRSIPIDMRRKAPHEHVERFRMREAKLLAAPIRKRLETWSTSAVPILADARPELPDELDDRLRQRRHPYLLADHAHYLALGETLQRDAAKLIPVKKSSEIIGSVLF